MTKGQKECLTEVKNFMERLNMWREESQRQLSNIFSSHSKSIDTSFSELAKEFGDLEAHVSELKKERNVLLDTINNLNGEIRSLTVKSRTEESEVQESDISLEIQDVKVECEESPELYSDEGESVNYGDNFDQRAHKEKILIKDPASNINDSKEFLCNVCQFVFSTRENLNIHFQNVHSEVSNIRKDNDDKLSNVGNCDVKEKRVMRGTKPPRNHKLHSKEYTRFKCEHCPYQTSRRDSLNSHLDGVHNDGVKRFKCEKCSYSSATKRCLRHHMASVHNVGELLKCEKCPYSSAWRTNLKNHMRSVHNIGDKLQCEQCPYETSMKAILNRHWDAIHNKGVKRFKCEICPHSYAEKHKLKCHMVSVHNIGDKLQCEKCSYSSALKRDLRNHMASVHNIFEELFKCEKCPYSSPDKGNLKKHRQAVHKISA